MPRSSFGVSALQGATPGLSRLAMSIGGGQGAYDQGADAELGRQSKMALALANIRAQNAAADAHGATADQTRAETGVLTGRGNAIDESVALDTGSTLPMVRAVQEYARTGVRPMNAPVGPPTEDGAEAAAFPVVDDGTQSKIAKALARSLVLRTNLKDTKADDLAQANQIYRQGDLSDQIIAGTADRNRVAGAQAAASGKEPLYRAGENGAVLDLFGGGLNESGGLAKANIGLVGAKTGAEKALAVDRYASAGAHNASASKTRLDIEQGIKTGDIVVVTDNDGNTSLLNKRTGISRPATTADGVPLIGKSKGAKDIPAAANEKIIAGKQGLRNIDQAIAALEAHPDAVGISNMIPGVQTMRQQFGSAADTDVRAQIANIGSLKLHDRSGAAVSASEFPRLAPFIPSASDSPKAAATKLKQMKRIAEEELGLYADTYSPENGYRASPVLAAPAAPAAGFKYLGKE